MMTGMTSMMRSVVRGDSPMAVIPAYDREPSSPAAPVPELHVETQFLKQTYPANFSFDSYQVVAFFEENTN